jgi:nitrite reductase (NO-forming)
MTSYKVLLVAAAVAVVIIAGISAAYYWRPSNTIVQTSERKVTVQITLYAGETSSNFSFGLSPDNLTSPGPTLRFTADDVVQITLVNVGKMPHSFAVTDASKQNATVLFNARISPVSPGANSSVIFAPYEAGEYYYVCQVPGHVSRGMWGIVIVEPSPVT